MFIRIKNVSMPTANKGSVYILTLIAITVISLFVMVFVQKVHYETVKSRAQVNRFKASKLAQLAFNKALYTAMTSYSNKVGSKKENFTRPDISGWTLAVADKEYVFGHTYLTDFCFNRVTFLDMNRHPKKLDQQNQEFVMQISTDITLDGVAYNEFIEAECITTTKDTTYGFEAIRINKYNYLY